MTRSDGCMVVVVGPSGAGKDTILRESRSRLHAIENIGFVKRVVTRVCDPKREDHHSASVDAFLEMSANGEFAVEWQAHSLYYGIPVDTAKRVASGEILIVNGSRSALPDFRGSYTRCKVIWITASTAVLAERLSQRTTEDPATIRGRLARSVPHAAQLDDLVIDNNGSLQSSIDMFVNAILAEA